MLVPDAVGNSKRWSFVASSSRTAILEYLFEIEGTCSGYRSLFRIGNQPNIALVSACGSWVLPL